MCPHISAISRSTISAYFGVSPYRDICWTIGDPLSRYCKPVVASCGKQKIASTHSHRRAQEVWHSLTIIHVAAEAALVASWHNASWIGGGRYQGLGGPCSACTAAATPHSRTHYTESSYQRIAHVISLTILLDNNDALAGHTPKS